MNEYLTLKWGTLKSWNFEGNDRAAEILQKYASYGMAWGAMQQRDTPEQKQLICELIDAGNFETVCLDWEGKDVSKEEAKKYVMEYGQKKAAVSSIDSTPGETR